MKSCKLVLMIPILLLVALATACDNDSIARNTSDECPGTYLMPITSSSEFKREYFRRNSRAAEKLYWSLFEECLLCCRANRFSRKFHKPIRRH